jgi:diguanylate cyclase (GGDEF)-like protein/PAS domain S-box-containing protein
MKKVPQETAASERRRAGRRIDDTLLPVFRDMVDHAVHGVLVHSNFKPFFVNESFAHLFGYDSVEEIQAMPLVRPLFTPDVWPEVEEDYNSLVRGQRYRPMMRFRGLRRDGSEIWLAATRRVIDWNGQMAVHVCAFDITAQVALEQVLLGNEQLLRSVLEILPVPIFIVRRHDGKIVFVNRKTCLLFQQGASPLLKTKVDDFFISAEDQEKFYQLVDTVQDVRELEIAMRTSQSREFMAEIAAIKVDYMGEKAVLISLNDVSERKKMEAELFHQANTDALTGLSNRRHFMILAEQEVRRARRFGRDLSVIMMDLDHFKRVNDTYGHATGDLVLETLCRSAQESLRESDIMGRLGGEEFAILLPETSLEAAGEVAGRILTHVAETPIPTHRGEIHCTTSLGVSCLLGEDESIDDILHRADEALYKAKHGGRNRYEVVNTLVPAPPLT